MLSDQPITITAILTTIFRKTVDSRIRPSSSFDEESYSGGSQYPAPLRRIASKSANTAGANFDFLSAFAIGPRLINDWLLSKSSLLIINSCLTSESLNAKAPSSANALSLSQSTMMQSEYSPRLSSMLKRSGYRSRTKGVKDVLGTKESKLIQVPLRVREKFFAIRDTFFGRVGPAYKNNGVIL